MRSHETFRDPGSQAALLYRADLSAGGVRFSAEALQRLNPNDVFTIKWREFEERCKEDHWQEAL